MPRETKAITFLNEQKTVRLSHDGLQWILEVGDPRFRRNKKDSGYRGRAFVATDKDVLLSCVQEKELDVDLSGRRVLAALPQTYREFLCDGEPSGKAQTAAQVNRRAKPITPIPERSVRSRKARIERLKSYRLRKSQNLGRRCAA